MGLKLEINFRDHEENGGISSLLRLLISNQIQKSKSNSLKMVLQHVRLEIN